MVEDGDSRITRPFNAAELNRKLTPSKSLATKLRNWCYSHAPPTSASPRRDSSTITVVCISDTQNTRPAIPNGDILLHAGNLSQNGTFIELQAAIDWLNSLPHLHKVVIGGSTDLLLDESFVERYPDHRHRMSMAGKAQTRSDLKWGQIKYLQNESHTLNVCGRTLHISGSPYTPRRGVAAFTYWKDEDVWTGHVPDTTHILLVHGPPAVHLDEGKGCRFLLQEIKRVKPQLVVCGNVQSARGEEWMRSGKAQELYEEIMLGPEKVEKSKLVRLWFECVKAKISRKGKRNGMRTKVVNAAVIQGDEERQAVVVQL
jgi:hypothetical protein